MRNTNSIDRQTAGVHESQLRQHVPDLIAWAFSVLALALAGCGDTPTQTPTPTPSIGATPIDYSEAQSWETLPSASEAVDVFFVYPTTYSAPAGALGSTWTAEWNQSLEKAWSDTVIKLQVASKAGVFAKAGTNLFVPYYQQASGLDALSALLYGSAPQNTSAATEALQAAYTDVSNAFDYYMAHFNRDASGNPRPFILAGHSQGSNLLLMLLENKFSDPSLRQQLVAAYVIGWSVTSDDMNAYPDSLQQLGICGIPVTRTTGCIVTYNTQAYAGDWTQAPGSIKYGITKANAFSVNPLTGVASGPGEIEPDAAPATANLGAVFYRGQLGPSPVPFTPNPTGDYTYEIANYTGAQNNMGGLVIDPSILPDPASQSNLAPPYNQLPMFHGYDYTFFYRNLEQNAIDRINAHNAANNDP